MYVESLFWQISAILEKYECHRHHDFTTAILMFMYFSSVQSIYDDLDHFLVIFFFFLLPENVKRVRPMNLTCLT